MEPSQVSLTAPQLILSECYRLSLPVGHTFTLTVDSLSNEITYDPLQKSPIIPADSMLADTACFPDYMQSRFLLNLLNTTFIQLES